MWSHPSVHLGAVGPLRRSSGPRWRWEAAREFQERPRTGPLVRDKDAPLAAFESRVPVKLDIASWLRANPHPEGLSSREPRLWSCRAPHNPTPPPSIRPGTSAEHFKHFEPPRPQAYEFSAATAICKCSNQIIYSRRAYIISYTHRERASDCCSPIPDYRFNGHILRRLSRNEHL